VDSQIELSNNDRIVIVTYLLKDADFSSISLCKLAIEKVIFKREWTEAFFQIERVRNCSVHEAVMIGLTASTYFSTGLHMSFFERVVDHALAKLNDPAESSTLSKGFLVEAVRICNNKQFAHRLACLAEQKLLELIQEEQRA
jgi:hypothetical protein